LRKARILSNAPLTLSGEQIVQGVGLSAGNIVAANGQAVTTENGLWVVQLAAWTRPADFDATTTALAGEEIYIRMGDHAREVWFVSAATDPVVGTDAIDLDQRNRSSELKAGSGVTLDVDNNINHDVAGEALITVASPSEVKTDAKGHVVSMTAGGASGNVLERGAVRAASSDHLAGLPDVPEGTVIGGAASVVGDLFVLMGQNNPAQNGVWIQSSATLMPRSTSFNESAEFVRGMNFHVLAGDYAGVRVYYDGIANPTLGTDPLPFKVQDAPDGQSIDRVGGLLRLPPRLAAQDAAGVYHSMSTFRLRETGVLDDVRTLHLRPLIVGLAPRINPSNNLLVDISPGFAYNIGAKKVVNLEGESTSDPSNATGLAANTWYYAYIGNPGFYFEFSPSWSTIAPQDAFHENSTTRKDPLLSNRGGNNDYRLIAQVRTNGSGGIFRFKVLDPGNHPLYLYLENITAAPFRVLSLGTVTDPTAPAAVDCSAVVPPNARTAKVRFINTSTDGTVRISNSEAGVVALMVISANSKDVVVDLPLTVTQTFTYQYTSARTNGGLFADVVGYYGRR
jgi:hypothetical protein